MIANFVGKHIQLLGVLLLSAFAGTAATLYFDLPGHFREKPQIARADGAYACPMHPAVRQDRPGRCPECGMALVAAGTADPSGCANHESGCCASKTTVLGGLPPGHPPIDGCRTNAPATALPQSH
jgi:hypothetical protein